MNSSCELTSCIKHKACTAGKFHVKPHLCGLRKEFLATLKFKKGKKDESKN
jgi:hypothetical protein